jgi:hypothetical protein
MLRYLALIRRYVVMSLEGLSKGAMLRRILRIVERTELLVSAASDYMVQALDGLDRQMDSLKARVQADADALQSALADLDLAQEDSEALVAAADRVNATAHAVASLATPSQVADPEQPDVVAEPLPTENETGGPTGPTGPDFGGETGSTGVGENVVPGTGGETGVDARPGDATAPPEQTTPAPVEGDQPQA